MNTLTIEEILNLYLILSDKESLPDKLEKLLIKLEGVVYNNYTVREIEEFRSIFNNKGVV